MAPLPAIKMIAAMPRKQYQYYTPTGWPNSHKRFMKKILLALVLSGAAFPAFAAKMPMPMPMPVPMPPAAQPAPGTAIEIPAPEAVIPTPPKEEEEPREAVFPYAGRVAFYWAPSASTTDNTPLHPLIIFSHGFSGGFGGFCISESHSLPQILADNGYWVFAPDHKDSHCLSGIHPPRPDNFGTPGTWTDKSFEDRKDDIVALINTLKASPRFNGLIDFNRMGLAGFSLGGYTVLGMSGGWQRWKTPGIKAVAAIGSPTQGFHEHGNVTNINVPVMFQDGARDNNEYVKMHGGTYDLAAPPKYYIEIQGADHLDLNNPRFPLHAIVGEYVVAFFDHYIKGDAPSPILTNPVSSISMMNYDSELGKSRKIIITPAPRVIPPSTAKLIYEHP